MTEIAAAFDLLQREWGSLDILVHAVAFAPREALTGSFVDNTSPRGLPDGPRCLQLQPHRPGPRRGAADGRPAGAVLTLSYLGAVRSHPELQRHGTGQGQPGGQRALPGRRTWVRGASG